MTGPLLSALIAMATNTKIGDKQHISINDRIKSIALLIYLYIIDGVSLSLLFYMLSLTGNSTCRTYYRKNTRYDVPA